MQKCCSRPLQQRIERHREGVFMERANNQGVMVKDAPRTLRASRVGGGAATTRAITQEMEPEERATTRHFPEAPKREPSTRTRSRGGSNTAWAGISMIATLLVLLFIFGGIVPWVTGVQHRWDCGSGNVCVTHVSLFKHGQVDTVLSFDSAGSVDVLIAPAGDMLHSKVYVVMTATTPGKYVSVTPVDINGDGKMDLFVFVEGDGMTHSLLNNGDGTFTLDGMSRK